MGNVRTIGTVELASARIVTLSQVLCNQLRVPHDDSGEAWDMPSVNVLMASIRTLEEMAGEVERLRSRVTSKVVDRLQQLEEDNMNWTP